MLLSCTDADLLAGNFMADFITNKDKTLLDPNIMQGIELHKKIDRFTDEHDEVRAAIRLLHPTQGKYAPVTTDILFDHFLTIHWARYSPENIHTFTERTYTMLESKKDISPSHLPLVADTTAHRCEKI